MKLQHPLPIILLPPSQRRNRTMQACLNSVDGNYFVRPHIASLKIVEYAYGNKNREDFIDRKCKGVVVAKREVFISRARFARVLSNYLKKKR